MGRRSPVQSNPRSVTITPSGARPALLPGIRAASRLKCGGAEQGSGIRVKEYLPIVETVARTWLIGAGHPVSVVLRSRDRCGLQSAVPNPPGFIGKGIESVFMERLKVLVG